MKSPEFETIRARIRAQGQKGPFTRKAFPDLPVERINRALYHLEQRGEIKLVKKGGIGRYAAQNVYKMVEQLPDFLDRAETGVIRL